MHLLLLQLAIVKILHGTLADIINTPQSVKVAAAENAYDVKGYSNVGVEPRIRGGQLAKEGQIPWQAGILCLRKAYKVELGPLRYNTFPFKYLIDTGDMYTGLGGATLISDRHLLTAAHMISLFIREDRMTKITTEIEVKLGTLNVYDGDIKFKTSKFIVHPEYDTYHILWPLWNDIAIIELPTSVSFTRSIYPALLPESPLIGYENITAIASGYGRCDAKTPSNGILRYVRMRIPPNKHCTRNINENQMCTESYRFRRGEPAVYVGICSGDSGSPIVISTPKQDEYDDWMDTYTVLGVASYSLRGCTGPSVYTRVSSYMSFIRNYTNL